MTIKYHLIVETEGAVAPAMLGCTPPDSLEPFSIRAKRNPEMVAALKVDVLNMPLIGDAIVVVNNGH